MKLKHAIIENMGRHLLKTVCDDLEIAGIDRRSRDDMAVALSRTRRAKPEELIEYLSEKQVKAVCELMRIEARGRRNALIELLLNGTDAATQGSSPTDKNNSGRARRPRVERSRGNDTEEEVSWMPANVIDEKTTTEHTETRPLTSAPRHTGHEITRTELVWPGKYDDAGHVVEPPRIALPFQVIEVIEEGRASREALVEGTLPLFGERPRGPEDEGWRNKLIWGDNLLIASSLLDEFAGRVDLIYIDPPFATGLDFSVRTVLGDGELEVTKRQSLVEEHAYRDTWGRGWNSYLSMLYQRFRTMRELLSPRGSIYVHIGPQVNHMVRLLLDELFGDLPTHREIIWKRVSSRGHGRFYPATHDAILFYTRSDEPTWNQQYEPLDPKYVETKYRFVDRDGRRYRKDNCLNQNRNRPNLTYEWNGHLRTWRWTKERMQELHDSGRLVYTSSGMPEYKRYLEESEGIPLQSVWTDISPVNSQAHEDTGYDTQKPEALLERIISSSSNPGDLVVDLFCGSGTTLAVAERLGRRWVGADLGRFAVHTSRKRLLSLRVNKEEGGEQCGCAPFEVLNLGRYERKYWQGFTFGEEGTQDTDRAALAAYLRFILSLYRAQPLAGQHIHGRKGAALVHIGAIDAPVTISQIEQALQEATERGGRELHVLGWEWEMGLHDPLAKMAKAQHGVTLRLLNIPREVMDRRAVDAGGVQFFDLAYLEVDVRAAGRGSHASRRVKIKLKDFVIPNTDLIPDEVRNRVRKWSDYIDYWAVDWDFRDDTFINQWQTYRTRSDRSLALETPEHAYETGGKYRILVKVIDIFGNDTSHLLEWEAK